MCVAFFYLVQLIDFSQRLGLPCLYDSLKITGVSTPLIAKQLERCPDLGSFIRVIFLSSFPDRVPDDTLHVILSHATHVEFFPFQGLHTFSPFSPQNFELLARTTGSSLREFAGSLPSSTEMPMAIFHHFPELRVLDLMECSPVFTSNQSVPVNGLNKLHTLRVHKGGFRGSLFQGLSTMRCLLLRFYLSVNKCMIDWSHSTPSFCQLSRISTDLHLSRS